MSNTIKWAVDAHDRLLDEPTARALQAAGVNHMSRNLYASDEARRDEMFRRLQQTLPADTAFFHERGVGKSLALTDPARVEPRFRQQFEKVVCDCAIAAASSNATLRPVTTFDQVGREIVEFVGRKSAWMSQYRAPALLMTRMGSAEY